MLFRSSTTQAEAPGSRPAPPAGASSLAARPAPPSGQARPAPPPGPRAAGPTSGPYRPVAGHHSSGGYPAAGAQPASLAENRAVWIVLGVIAAVALVVILVVALTGGGS